MLARPEDQIDAGGLAAIKGADDRFWELTATYGDNRPASINPDQACYWTRRRIRVTLEAPRFCGRRGICHDSDQDVLAALGAVDADAIASGG